MSFRFFPGPERKWLAVIAAALSLFFAISALFAAIDTYDWFLYSNSISYRLTLNDSIVPENLPPFAEFSLMHPVLLSAFIFVILLESAVISFGIWRGRAWARISAVYSFYVFALLCLAFIVFPSFILPNPILRNGTDAFPEFNAGVARLSMIMRIAAAILCSFCIFAARFFEKLSKYPGDNFYLPENISPVKKS